MSEPLKESELFPGAHPAPEPANEAERLQALRDLDLLDTLPEVAFDDIVQVASAVCGVPIALVSLIDSERQWFKARVGLDATQTHRDIAFCGHALNTPEQLFEVPDALADTRFANNPLVTGDLGIRFYAGMPLVTPDGHALGTLCVIDHEARKLTPVQTAALQALARRVMSEMELRTTVTRLKAAQRTAEERRAVIESIIESIPNAMMVVDKQRQVLINNAESQAINGLNQGDVLEVPQHWPATYGVYSADGQPISPAEIPLNRALNGDTVRGMELQIRNARQPDGIVVESNAKPVVDNRGEQIGAIVILTNVTERKRAAAVLAASEARYRFLSEAIPLQVWTAQPSGEIDFINGFAANYFGRSNQQLIEMGWHDLIHADDIATVLQRWAQSVTTAEPYEVEMRVRRHDGEYRWNLARALALKNADGQIEKWFGTSFEIEEIKQAQTAADQLNAALLRSEEHYRFLSEAIPLQVWTARPDGQLDYVNGYTADYMGRSARLLLTESWNGLLHPDDVERTYKTWMHSVTTAEPYDIEYRLRRADGSFRWNLTRGLALKNAAGAVEKWFGSTVEIEEIKHAQRLAEDSTRAKSAFLSSMSHEIRTPMNAVIGMTSILLDSGLTPEQRESAEVIRTSGDHLLTIINDILDYSKIEAGRLELERNAFSLRECIEGALDLVAASASVQGVELGYLMEAGMPESVLGDIGRLRQVLLNLLSNAVKFTPRGGDVMVEVREQRLDDGRHRIEFSVSDSGVGIDAEVLPQLFQPFVQADASTTRRFGGTGLGLSISRRLVEAMGGSIGVESIPGQGSIFRFSIVTEVAAAGGRYSPPTVLPQLGGRRVLIVDDIEINRRILIHYVRTWGMVPHATEFPREALEWLERGDVFDLALFDYHMPDIDGLTLSRRTRAVAPKLAIVILSSVALETADVATVSGAMLKPIKPARLLEAIGGLLTPTETRAAPGSALPELPRELGHQHPLRLLVVEDNPVNQRVARLLLERMGYIADFAGNGEEALNSVARQTYDVVLMDVQMPVMDGLTATRELCRRYPLDTRPRIVGMTANATEDDRRNCIRAGMDDYLPKPVRPQELAAALRASPRRDIGVVAQDDFSAEGLAELRRVYGDEGALEIIGALLADLDAQSAELQRSLESNTVSSVQRVAHTLKSNSRLVGALTLGDHWEEVERLTQAAAVSEAGRLALALMGRYGRLVRHLQRQVQVPSN